MNIPSEHGMQWNITNGTSSMEHHHWDIINRTSPVELLQDLGGCAMHNKPQWSKGMIVACMTIHKASVLEYVLEHLQQNITSG